MDSRPINELWDTSRKKYILSLKNRLKYNTIYDAAAPKDNTPEQNNEAVSDKKRYSDISELGDSQNFSLRLSDSYIVDDTIEVPQRVKIKDKHEKEKETEIIVISDSSDDECTDLKQLSEEKISLTNSGRPDPQSSMTFSTIDMSEIWTDDERKSATPKNKDTPIRLKEKDTGKYNLSDGENNINLNNISSGKNAVPKPDSSTQNDRLILSRDGEDLRTIRTKQYQDRDKIISTSSSDLNKLQDVNSRHNNDVCGTPSSAKCPIRTTPLTKKDARDIARAIKSKRAVYNSPGQWQRRKEIIDSDSDTSEDTKASQEKDNEKNKIKHPVWINETDSESSDATPNNHEAPRRLIKTHVTRFLDPTITDQDSAQLSLRKKEEISRWLLSNPIDSRSDTSMSYVPPSEQNSLSSGNSSLDRLELKFETPNNRDKFKSKTYINDNNTKTTPTLTREVQSDNVRQTTMDSFFRKVKCDDKDISFYTPIPITRTKKVISPALSPGETSNIQIGDCADILDKLYGDVWRDKAEDLLPRSEPKKANLKVQDRAVQTERKKIIKSKKNGSSSALNNKSNDYDFNTFMNNIRPNLNSTKKSEVNSKKWRNSFINDRSSSDYSDGETTFQTALTTPQVSNLRDCKKKETPMSALTMRAIEICDSDTEDDDQPIRIKKVNDNVRRLSFSDDEIDLRSSPGTSEYDPEDVIPPKTVIRSTNMVASKLSTKSSTYGRLGATKSFLASLSSSVPLANAHPDAKKYRNSYKNNRDDLCKYLYKMYNDKIFNNKLPDDMLIEWNVRMRGTAGFCYNKTKKKALGTVERSSRIVLATKILDAPDRLRDTLVHEMCHAATWLINEVSDGHGPFWQAWASKAMKAFPELPSIKRCHDYKIATKYTYRCVDCGYSIGRHSKSLDVERKRCGHCYGKFELLINKVTKSGTVQVKTPSNKKPTGFALFVKENYNLVKKERRDVRHKEVMQILGQQFSAIKVSKENNNVDF